MIYACMCINIRVQVYVCAYAIRKKYSPISGKYLKPHARVHVCARRYPRGCPGTVGGRRGLWIGFLERENAKKREKPRERKLRFWFWRREKELMGVWCVWGIEEREE